MRRRPHKHLITVLQNLQIVHQQHDAQLRALVRQAIEAGAPSHEIAKVLGISRATVWRRFREELRADAQQTPITASKFATYGSEAGLSLVADEHTRARRRTDRSTPPPRLLTDADGAGISATIRLDARRVTQQARAAQRKAMYASRRASELTRAIAIELETATRLRQQRARPELVVADRSQLTGGEQTSPAASDFGA